MSTPKPPTSRITRRAVILTALPVEYNAVRAHIVGPQEEVHPQGTVYERGRFPSEVGEWDVVLVEIGPGNQGAAMEAERAISHYQPEVALFVGVAGGLKDVAIGDVVAATKVYGYESGKARAIFEPRPDVGQSSYALVQRARAVARTGSWIRRLAAPAPISEPKVLVAPIAAGEKVISDTRADVHHFLRTKYGDALAVEMEGRGFLTAAHANSNLQALVVRGISDCIDAKAEADASGSQELASRHAGAFAFEVLARYYLPERSVPISDAVPQNNEPVWTAPYPPNPAFAGRSTLLTTLREHFSTSPEPMPQALCGLGGVGKTQLAVEYAARHTFKEQRYTHVLWVRANATPLLASSYATLADHLGLPERVEVEQRSKVAAVQRWLVHHENWLLIFDNAEQPELLRPYLPPSIRGHVLITSRNPAWGSLAVVRQVDGLSPQESVELLTQRTGQHDEQAALSLASELEGLPLALIQAASYIEQTGKTLGGYLDLFRQRQQEMLSRPGAPSDYSHTVATTWELSFEQVHDQMPDATDLLALCSFFASAPIPVNLLKAGADMLPASLPELLADEVKFDEALVMLRRYSLVQIFDESLLFHRLVQAVMAHRLAEQRPKWAEAALHLVQRFFQFNEYDLDSWVFCMVLLPHAISATQHSWVLEIRAEALPVLLADLGVFWVHQAEYESARVVVAKGFEVFQVLDVSDFSYRVEATLLQVQGMVLLSLRELSQSRANLERALAIIRRHPSLEHQQSEANILGNLSTVLIELGVSDEARAHAEHALRISEATLGNAHPLFGLAADRLARVLIHQAKFEEARPYAEQALVIAKNTLGPHHHRTAIHLSTMGGLLEELGDYEEAKRYYAQALDVMHRTYGPEHPNVSILLRNIGHIDCITGDLESAKSCAERALEIDEKCFGSEHPSVARSLSSLALILHGQGKHSQARRCLERAIAVKERGNEPDHSELSVFFDNLGRVQHAQGDLEAARTSFERALQLAERTFGADHPKTARVLFNLAELIRSGFNDLSKACGLFERALAVDEKIYGDEHPEVATDRKGLGITLLLMGEPDRARELLKRSIPKLNGPHASNALDFASLGNMFASLKQWKEAQVAYQVVLDAPVSASPKQLVRIHKELAVVLLELKQFKLAQKHFERALSHAGREYGTRHPVYADILCGLASFHERVGKPLLAAKKYERALDIFEQYDEPTTRRAAANVRQKLRSQSRNEQ